jgi:hypothetical protein
VLDDVKTIILRCCSVLYELLISLDGDETFNSLLEADVLVIIRISSTTTIRKNFTSLSFRRAVDHPPENFRIYPHQLISSNEFEITHLLWFYFLLFQSFLYDANI